jgi:hypothetical protein
VTVLPVSDLDRMSGNERIVYVAGPVAVPPREQLVSNLLALAELGPHTRVGLRLNETSTAWTYDPTTLREWCESIVREVPAITADEAVATTREYIRDEGTPAPFQLIVAGDFVILRMNHLLGDAKLLCALFDVAIAAPDRPIPEWLVTRAVDTPLSLAVRETFVKHPSQAAKVVRSQLSRFGAGSGSGGAAATGSAVTGIVDVPATAVPWQRRAEAAYSRGTVASARALKAWTHSTPGSITVAAAILVAARRALAAEGIAVRGESSMIYDSRRYLPAGAETNGNFIAGLPVPAGHSDDPRQVTAVVKANLDAASPLAAMLVGVTRTRLTGRRIPAAPSAVSSRPEARVVLTNIGVRRELDAMPWTVVKGDEHFVVWSEPSAPDDIVIGVIQLRGALHITAFFHGNVFDVDRVQAAVDRVTTNPISLLNDVSASDGVSANNTLPEPS